MARTFKQTRFRTPIIAVYFCLPAFSFAQGGDDVEYQMELGGGLGTSFYMGDVNGTPFAHMSGMGSIIARKIFNPRMALKGDLALGHISGNSEGYFIPTDATSETAEGGMPTKVSFSRNVIDFGAQFAMNFWGYTRSSRYSENSRFTPYALAGAGFTVAPGGAGTHFALNLPVGVGLKFKLRPRLNIGLEWTMRFTTSDALDAGSKEASQLIHPYGIKSVGLKNKDCYSFTMVFLTYDLCPKCKECHNNDD